MSEPSARRRLGRYQLLFRIAAGGMAEVWAAQASGEAGFSKLVAVKLMLPALADDPRLVAMFLDEGRLAAHIGSPYVVSTLDLGRSERGDLYQVMELVIGAPLAALLSEGAGIGEHVPVDVAVEILAQAAQGLHDAHEARSPTGEPLGIVHRDISPQNVLVDVAGRTRIADFGIAHALQRVTRSEVGETKGKLGYFAPEQARGERIDRRTDVFALGIVAWETIAGRRLFRGDNAAATVTRILELQIPRLDAIRDDVPRGLADVVAQALFRDPSRRPSTAGELARALRAAAPTADAATVGAFVRRRARAWVASMEAQIGAASAGAFDEVEERTVRDASLAELSSKPRVRQDLAPPRTDSTHTTPSHPRAIAAASVVHVASSAAVSAPQPSGAAASEAEVAKTDAESRRTKWLVAGGLVAALVGTSLGLAVQRCEDRPARLTLVAPMATAAPLDAWTPDTPSIASRWAPTGEGPRADGVAALFANDFESANALLRRAATERPDDGGVRLYLAILDWWRTSSTDVVLADIEEARARSLDPLEASRCDVLEAIVRGDARGAREGARAMATAYPDDGLAAYMLGEALFHGGDAAEAAPAFRRAWELLPQLELGAEHVVAYHAVRGEIAETESALRRASRGQREEWGVRLLWMRRDLEGVHRELVRVNAEAHPDSASFRHLVQYHVVRGDGRRALDLSERVRAAAGLPLDPVESYALRVLVNDEATDAFRVSLDTEARSRGRGDLDRISLREVLLRIGALRRTPADEAMAAAMRPALADFGTVDRQDPLHALAAGLSGDDEALALVAGGANMQAADMARAFQAERAGRLEDALAHWRLAADRDGRGYYLMTQGQIARLAHALGDDVLVMSACEEVLTPRVFEWAFAAIARDCATWSAEALDRAGRSAEAGAPRAFLAQLEAR